MLCIVFEPDLKIADFFIFRTRDLHRAHVKYFCGIIIIVTILRTVLLSKLILNFVKECSLNFYTISDKNFTIFTIANRNTFTMNKTETYYSTKKALTFVEPNLNVPFSSSSFRYYNKNNFLK